MLAIKRWFTFNFTKNLQGRYFVVDGPKNFKLLPDISFDRGFEKIIASNLLRQIYCVKFIASNLLLFSRACY